MTSDKPNPPIDLSRAKEPPRSLNLDEADTGKVNEHTNQSNEAETAENVGTRQVTIANIPGGSVLSGE